MMAGGFGGAVKLTGESEYRQALNLITQNLKEVASQMSVVSASFDATDRSEEALSAKTTVLNEKLEQQTTKLNVLKEQYAAMSQQYEQQTQKHTALVQTYEAEKTKLDEIGRTLGVASKEYQDQREKVTGLAQDVDKSTKAQNLNEIAMSKMRTEINSTGAECAKTAKEIDELGNEAEESGKKANDATNGGWSVFKQVIANLATQAINAALDGLKKLGEAMVAVGKQALDSYAEYEQLAGGVETLFGDSAATVMAYAEDAYKTAGISANQYMSQITSFSATLLQGLGGDTAKAAEMGNMAVTDMADNANKLGTDLTSIQNAYQGFAKQNYTMLDNLKLGYGGTAAEMARLINDSGVLGNSVKVTASDVKNIPFDTIIQAIHNIQTNIGITGTTTAEAMGTISGSAGSMKAAWANMLTGMANENANFEKLASAWVSSVAATISNIVPRISTVMTGMANVIRTVIPQLLQSVIPMITSQLPNIVNAVQSIISAVLALLPQIMPVISSLIPTIVQTLIGMLPQVLNAGIQILLALINGISQSIPQLVAMLPQVITSIVQTLMQNLPQIIQTGMSLLIALAQGLIQAIPQLVMQLPQIISAIVTGLLQGVQQMGQVGLDLVKGLWNGINDATEWVLDKIKGFGKSILDGIKRFFGIQSPSKVMRDQVGRYLAEGIGEGFTEEMEDVSKEMAGAIPSSFDVNPAVYGSAAGGRMRGGYIEMVEAFKEALADMKIELDDEVAGRFVDQTVTRLIYS